MPKPAKKSAMRGVIIIMTTFTALLLVGFTLLHAQLQGEVMKLMILSGGMAVIDAAAQIRTADDADALENLAREMKIGFDLESMVRFRGYHQFRPLAVIKVYDQDDQLVAMESCPGGDPKRIARLEEKADEYKRKNWTFLYIIGGAPRTNLFKSTWLKAHYIDLTATDVTAVPDDPESEEELPEWFHMEGDRLTLGEGVSDWMKELEQSTENAYATSGYLYYSFAAEGYPLLISLQKLLPVYFWTAIFLFIAIHLVKRRITAIHTTPTEDT